MPKKGQDPNPGANRDPHDAEETFTPPATLPPISHVPATGTTKTDGTTTTGTTTTPTATAATGTGTTDPRTTATGGTGEGGTPTPTSLPQPLKVTFDQAEERTLKTAADLLVSNAEAMGQTARDMVDATYLIAEKISASPALSTTERGMTLRRAGEVNTATSELWIAIAAHTDAISFDSYEQFIEDLLCNRTPGDYRDTQEEQVRSDPDSMLAKPGRDRMFTRMSELRHLPGGELYELLRTATEAFLLIHTGVYPPVGMNTARAIGANSATGPVGDPYDRLNTGIRVNELESKLSAYLGTSRNNYLHAIARQGALRIAESATEPSKYNPPPSPFCMDEGAFVTRPLLLELIWNYWHEEAMLTQTTAAITRRFQNVRRAGPGPDPLGELELHPLRGLSGFLWGYLRDEPQRLTVARRAYEYSHQYGLTLWGKAVPSLGAADPRPRFLEAFHNLLRQAVRFYREDADTTVIADAFPVLNSIREVHLVLAEGAHNQFRDLPWTARVEMLMQQWLLARPEMREFLRGRQMVPYPEGWMGSVDAMKRLQGWGDTSVIHFRDLARFGERLLLSIRYGNWTEITSQDHAVAWLRYWKEEVQGYIHSYFTATGVNLSDDAVEVSNRADVRYVQPSYHLRNRLLASRRALNASR
ncbi:hypothetical protein [Longimicrobium sp.]|jgi:hypothetical protein|uniref:hypothetical protein n=1 Tax=Longimicrobium sp. TaxID=2029185 RepID=UPI002F924923